MMVVGERSAWLLFGQHPLIILCFTSGVVTASASLPPMTLDRQSKIMIANSVKIDTIDVGLDIADRLKGSDRIASSSHSRETSL
jgi:hypothetical protein